MDSSIVKLGMIVRADDGGLGVQTWEIARHLRPERVLIVDLRGHSRGTFRPDRFEDVPERRVASNPPEPDDCRWLLDGIDHLLTVEGFYQERIISMAVHAGVGLTVYANPELFPRHYRELSDRKLLNVLAPTDWLLGRLGANHALLPMPVARDRVTYRHRTGPARTFLHVSAPAMLDRNGTAIVKDAARHYDGPDATLLVAGPGRPPEPVKMRRLRIVPLEPVDDYWRLYDDADALVMPRRYGGLSLVAQEAFAAGMPAIMMARKPETAWPTVRVPTSGSRLEHMKGGDVEVFDAAPADVAEQMRHLAEAEVGKWSTYCGEWVDRMSWDSLLPEWRTVFPTEPGRDNAPEPKLPGHVEPSPGFAGR